MLFKVLSACALKCMPVPPPEWLGSPVCSHPARSEINRSHPVGSGTSFLMRLELHAAQSAQCMRLKPMPVPHLVGLDRPCVHIQHAEKINRSHPVGPGTSFSCVSNHMLLKVLSACTLKCLRAPIPPPCDRLCAHIQHAEEINRSLPVGPRNIFLMRLESHAAQSAQCMRLKPMPVPHLVGLDRPCVHIQLAQRQTQSHPVSWPPAGTAPVFRLREITHENPNTTGESFRVPPPRRPGAKSPPMLCPCP